MLNKQEHVTVYML